MSPRSAPPAVDAGGRGGAAPVGLLPAGSRPADACGTAHLCWPREAATGCPTDPEGAAGPATGTIISWLKYLNGDDHPRTQSRVKSIIVFSNLGSEM